jgi:DNA-binding NarL/FixJ family response regulator
MNAEQFDPARFRSDLGTTIPASSSGGISMSQPERGNEILTPLRLQRLILYANGLESNEIAMLLGYSTQSVKNNAGEIRKKLGCLSTRGAIVKAVDLGMFDTQYLVPDDFDPAILDTLTLGEKDVLTRSVGDKSQKEIAADLAISLSTVKGIAERIISKTKSANMIQAVVFYLEARRRKQEEVLSKGEDASIADVFDLLSKS